MKYLAILRDSLREAVDTKVLYAMIGLSCLLIGLTACLSFKPRSVAEMVPMLTGTLYAEGGELTVNSLPGLMHGLRHRGDSEYEIVAQHPLEGKPDVPSSNFSFTVRARFSNKEQAEAARRSPQETEQLLRRRFGRMGDLEMVQVTDVQLVPGGEGGAPGQPGERDLDFEVKTHPTTATVRLWPHELSLFFGALPLGGAGPIGVQLFLIMSIVVLGIGSWVIILVSVIITAFFIPNMLRKGTIDLLLVKPLHRGMLLLYKYTGGLIFIFLNTTFAIVGVWLVLGLRSGIWANSFLLSIFVYTFFFAILYSASTLFGVLTRSPIAAILLTLVVWFLLFSVGAIYNVFDTERHMEEQQNMAMAERWGNNTFGKVIDVVHFVLPRTSDLNTLQQSFLLSDLITVNQVSAQKVSGTSVTWAESLTVSAVFIALMLGLSTLWFVTRDY